MSDPVRPHRWQPIRLPHPWYSPGKNTGVGCHFHLQRMKVKRESEVAQSCLTPSDPMDCRLPGSAVHGIFQARVLEWGAIAFSDAGFIEYNKCWGWGGDYMHKWLHCYKPSTIVYSNMSRFKRSLGGNDLGTYGPTIVL